MPHGRARREAGPAGRPAAQLFGPVEDRRVSGLIVDQVRALMHEGKLVPGDRLPPLGELCTRFGASRVTVREALRILEAGGLIEVRVGSGVHVRRPGSDHLATRLRDLLSLSSAAARDVTEARTLLEVGIVPLLCGQADDQDIAALLDICDRQERLLVEHERYDTSLSTAFHARLAAATHNTAFEVLIRSFRGSLRTAFAGAAAPTPEAGLRVLREHRAILAAIQARDPATGTGAMRDHLASVRLRLLGAAG